MREEIERRVREEYDIPVIDKDSFDADALTPAPKNAKKK